MFAVRLRVRGIVGHEAAEFEKVVWQWQPPYRGLPLPEGRAGQLVVCRVKWSAVFGAYLCRAKDDIADQFGAVKELAAVYAGAGWKKVRHLTLYTQRPRRRRRVAS